MLPLRYNNPGLTVDLGVGLWAWPMPMDYDGDGDMDLLVACPDKPSNGVYYFENPTQDPNVTMPVFRPGVRLGPAGHNMQISYVAGKARILQEVDEFPKFREGDFETRNKIYGNPRFHSGKTRARMWRYCDFDGDGDQGPDCRRGATGPTMFGTMPSIVADNGATDLCTVSST